MLQCLLVGNSTIGGTSYGQIAGGIGAAGIAGKMEAAPRACITSVTGDTGTVAALT